jgi:acetyl/propionyl-CoA carboxylase alpha subunit
MPLGERECSIQRRSSSRVDLVEEMIRVAGGEWLRFGRADIS